MGLNHGEPVLAEEDEEAAPRLKAIAMGVCTSAEEAAAGVAGEGVLLEGTVAAAVVDG